MIPYLGNIALWLALFFSLVQIYTSFRNIYNQPEKETNVHAICVVGIFACIALSFLTLMYAYIVSDFSLLNVFNNSHSAKPFLYKITGTWGNHEGSMILWLFALAVYNFFIYKKCYQAEKKFLYVALISQAIIITGFLLFVIFTSNPFERITPTPLNGLGLNPVLQDPALAIHPPLLYFGYLGFSATFSIALASLIAGSNKTTPWHDFLRPFAIVSWTLLTIGIAIGSIWSYYELGWGGWWAWDPVENSSFVPWLIGTALVHSVIVLQKQKSLESWTLFLSIVAFLFSCIGTFLVRSGILTSVHTFAQDPKRGIYILSFIALLAIVSLTIYCFKNKSFAKSQFPSALNKSSFILMNNIIMIVVAATIFLGTIYPLLLEALTENKISVGIAYYNSTAIPLLIPAVVLMGIAPILSWRGNEKTRILKSIFPTIIFTLILFILFTFKYGLNSNFATVGIFLGFWIICSALFPLIKKIKNKKESNANDFGMLIAHLGVGLFIIGAITSSFWQQEKITLMELGDKTEIDKYDITFREINEIVGKNYVAIRGIFEIIDKDKKANYVLKPENRYYPIANTTTTEASINTNIFRDLYIVLGQGNFSGEWIVRIYFNPLVMWIWIGTLFIFIGGLFALKNNLRIRQLLQK